MLQKDLKSGMSRRRFKAILAKKNAFVADFTGQKTTSKTLAIDVAVFKPLLLLLQKGAAKSIGWARPWWLNCRHHKEEHAMHRVVATWTSP